VRSAPPSSNALSVLRLSLGASGEFSILRPVGLRSIGRALRHRNYRLFFAGQSVSLVGTWVTRVAMSWLVYRLTDSALMLGLVGFAGQIPTFVLAPVAGVLVDRWNRHRVLVVTQVLAMIQSALLAAFALSGVITVWHIVVLAVFQGLVNAIDMPARQAFVVEMLESREDLPNAIALNSSMVNAARLIGPSLAGVLIALVGEGWCFLLDAVSYLPVLASLRAMRIAPRALRARAGRVLHELRDGIRYTAGFAPIRALLLLLALLSLMGTPYLVLMPVVAGRVLHGGSTTLGLLMGASGLGALAGALHLASRRSVLGLGRAIGLADVAFGLSLMAFSRSTVLWLSLSILVVTGAMMMTQMAATNTLIQTLVDDDKRGRVMSLYSMAFFGIIPFGSLLAGSLAHRIGTPNTVFLGGAVCLAGGLVFLAWLPELRRRTLPVYARLGILPDAAGDSSSAARGPGRQ
jgi:MFS family permease